MVAIMALRTAAFVRRPLVLASGGLYLIFCSLAPLGWLTEHYGTGQLSSLQLTAIAWPYPFLLALQHWVTPGVPSSFIVVDLVGLALVLGFVGWLQHQWSADQAKGRVLLRLAPVL